MPLLSPTERLEGLNEVPPIEMELGKGYLQIVQNFHLEGGKGKANANENPIK